MTSYEPCLCGDPECRRCFPRSDEDDAPPERPLSRQARLQALADAGCDTWEEYREER